MRTYISLAVLLLASGLVSQEKTPDLAVEAAAETPQNKIPLRVLLTGVEGSERLRKFRAFLLREFQEVGTTSFSEFKSRKAEAYDVVVLDAEMKPQPGKKGMPSLPRLGRDYNRATVLVATPGALLGSKLGLKTDYG